MNLFTSRRGAFVFLIRANLYTDGDCHYRKQTASSEEYLADESGLIVTMDYREELWG